MFISAAALRQHLVDPSWVVFDCRHDLFDHAKGRQTYEQGHIPGAFFAPVETELSGAKTGRNGRHPLPDPHAFAAFLGAHGVTADTQIVAYDDVGGQYAARLWWLARWIGLSRVAVLDGGLGQWVAGGNPVTSEPSHPRARVVTARPNAAMIVDAATILTGQCQRGVFVIDARAPERFRGDVEPLDPVAGHIPQAHNRPFKANLNTDGTIRPASELRAEFEQALGGVSPAQVVHQCGSGITACVNLMAMEHAGLAGSRLYVGSWSEWVADPTRPVVRGA